MNPNYTSTAAQKAAQRFLKRLQDGTIKKDILPNSFEDYTGRKEQEDLEAYNRYLYTLAYESYLENRKVVYYGD